MKKSFQNILLALVLYAGAQTQLSAQGTAFTYQGRLDYNGTVANGAFDLSFTVFGTNLTGVPLAGPLFTPAVSVSNGLFCVTLDFGNGVFTGPERWLEITVRPASTNRLSPYDTLAPRQQITAAPYAIFAGSASNLVGALPASQITGSISPTNIAPGTITSMMFAPGAVSMLGSPDGWPTNAVQVDTNGLVGIGTGTPAAGLHITSGANITTLPVVFEVANGQSGWTNLYSTDSTALKGSLLAVGGFNGLTIANITNPSAPAVMSQIHPSAGGYNNLRNVEGLAWAGSNLVAGAYGYGGSIPSSVFIIGCTNPASPVKLSELHQGVGGWNYLAGISSVSVSSNLLAIGASESNAVTLVDISNPSAPVLKSVMSKGVNGFTNLDRVNSVALSGNLLAIASYGSNAVTLVNVSNPAAPVKLAELMNGVGGYTNLTRVWAVALSDTGNLLAIAASGDFWSGAVGAVTLVDVSNPASPVKLAELLDGVGGYELDGASSLAFSGNRLVIDNANASSGNYAVNLVDVSNPARPVRLATAIDGLNGADYLWQPTGISIAGTNIMVGGYGNSFANQYGLTIFGIGSQSVGLVSAGWVGIGTTQPSAALHVVGDVLVENASLFNVSAERVALGLHASAIGFGSVAAGYGATASGIGAIALGQNTTATGNYSSAFGGFTTASGIGSTAMGNSTAADGKYSTAMGSYANAIHDHTFVWADGSVGYPGFASTTTNQFSVRATGGVLLNAGNNNVEIASGGIKVTGAGIGSSTAVFVHRATGTNIESGSIHRTTINNPYCNGNSNALLFVTANYNPGNTGNIIQNHPYGVYFNPGLAKWQIFNEDFAALTTNTAFNVMIVVP